MSKKRVILRNWIVKLGRDPALRDVSIDQPNISPWPNEADSQRIVAVRRAVAEAVAELADDERELVERYYYMGQTLTEIAEKSGRSFVKLQSAQRQVIDRLRHRLAPVVEHYFGIRALPENDCPICNSPYREDIDRLLAARDPTRPMRQVARQIRERFGVHIAAPQRLKGHIKYHCHETIEPGGNHDRIES